jgi:uncharacterized Zn ribbon protein
MKMLCPKCNEHELEEHNEGLQCPFCGAEFADELEAIEVEEDWL